MAGWSEHLMPMDVPAESDCEVARQVSEPDDIGAESKREASRSTRCALDALMQTENAQVGVWKVRRGCSDLLEKSFPHLRGIRKPDECHSQPTHREDEGARPIEHMKPLVHREQRIGHARAFVIAGNEHDRKTGGSDPFQRRQRAVGKPQGYSTAIQKIAAMHHDIDLTSQRRGKRSLEVVEEVAAAPPPRHTRSGGKVEPQVSVGQE